MPVLKNVLGLDIGSHSVKAVEFRQNLRGIEAVQLRSVERQGDDGDLADLLRRMIEVYRLPAEHVVAALPGDRISSRRIRFPFRERKKIEAAVPNHVADDLLFEPEDVIIDWELVSSDRARADVVAVIAPRKAVSEFLEPLADAECEPRTLEAEGLLLGNLAAIFDLPGVRLLADLGHRKSTFCLLVDERPVSARTIPLGGLALTHAIARDRGIDSEAAERAKCEETLIGPDFEATYPETAKVLDRLSREIVRTLSSLETVLNGRALDALTLFGGSAHLEGLDAYLEERIGCRTERLGYPPEGHDAGLVAAGDPVVFAPTIALGLRGTPRARTRTNFRQEEFAVRVDLGRFTKDFSLTGILAGIAGVLAIASFATSTALASRYARQIEMVVDDLYREAIPGQALSGNPLTALRAAVDDANRRAEFLGVYRGNLSALDLLNEISARVPADLDIVLEELSIDRQTVRLRVFASSFEAADRLGAELQKFDPFANARIGAIETDKKRGGKRFNVTISLAPRQSSR